MPIRTPEQWELLHAQSIPGSTGWRAYFDDPNSPAYTGKRNFRGSWSEQNKPVKKYPASIIDTSGAIKSLNKQYTKLTDISNSRKNPIYNSKVYIDANGVEQYGVDPKELESYAIQQRNTSSPTNENSVNTANGNFTLDEAMQLFGNDFTGLTQNQNGTYSASPQALERIGITGLSSPDTGGQYQTEIDDFDNQIQTLMNNFDTYNVDDDPDFQAEAQNIRSTYDAMRQEMRNTNRQRQRAYETLGYRTGSTQYAGAIQGGIVGEEIKQGSERIAEINRQESAAISAAKKAYKDGKYTEFAEQLKSLDTLRDNKAQTLADYNKSLADTYANMQKQNQFELDVLKYQLDLQKSGQTDLTKEYEYAKLEGLPEGVNNLMDYQLWKEETTANKPTSFQEWQLAGGLEGTGKSYGDFIATKVQGPSSYQEWNLAGGESGTGKTYAQWIMGSNGADMNTKQQAIFNAIVSKYSASPLIAAKDRTIVLENIIKQIKEDPKNGSLQLGLVYSYVQALDTYQSAVREGELSLVNSIDSKYGQLKNSIEKVQNGQIVREDVARQIADAAQTLIDTISQGAAAKEKMYRSQARVNGIENVWNDFIGGFQEQPEFNIAPLDKSYMSVQSLLNDRPDYDQTIQQIVIGLTEEGIEANDANVLQALEQLSSFNSVGGDTNISLDKLSSAIGQFESGGNYKAIGPDTGKGNKAYGKYQIMASNIPSWSKEALGYSITPQKFLESPQLQDKIAQYKMNQYLKKYGTVEDVASVWFSGRPLAKAGNAKDVIGTSVPKYVRNIRSIYNNLS